ncbi:MAG: outer membrane beta-barrel protein [Steroidobacteraceae bacterium]
MFLTVRDVQIEGTFPELAQQTAALIGQIQGRRVSLAEVYKFGDDLQAAYVTEGYILARVVVPKQNLQSGDIHISIIDGVIESLDLTGVPARSRELVKARLQPLIGQHHVMQKEIERRVLLLGDIAGLVGSSTVRSGTRADENILVITATEKMISFATSIDNRLPDSLGRWEISDSFALNNAFGWGEQLHAEVSSGTDFNHFFDSASKLQAYGGGFTLPIGNDGFNIAAAFSEVRTVPVPEPGTFTTAEERAVATFDRTTLRATYPLLLTLKDIVRVQLGFEHIDNQNRVGPEPAFIALPSGTSVFDLSQDRYEDVRLAGEWVTQFPWSLGGQATSALFYTRGLGGRTASDTSLVPLSQPGASPTFEKLKLDARVVQPLPDDFQLSLFVKAQTSFGDSLMLPEQLSLDGVDALSGFAAGTLNVDSGILARAELSRTFATDIFNSKTTVTPYVFAAWGEGDHVQPLVGQAAFIQAESIGAGFHANANVFFGDAFQETFSFEVAKNFTNVPFSAIPYEDSDYRATFSYVLRYSGTPFETPAHSAGRSENQASAPFWTGFYTGLNAGYGFSGDTKVSNNAVPVATFLDTLTTLNYSGASAGSASGQSSVADDGIIGGGQLGYNFRSDRVVWGAETDIQGSGIRGQSTFVGHGSVTNAGDTDTVTTTLQNEKAVDWLGTARARLGYVVTPGLLAYGTGGLAYGGVSDGNLETQQWNGTIISPLLRSSGATSFTSRTMVGWTLGAGFEWMFTPNMSLKAEYLYYDLGSDRSSPNSLQTTLPGFAPNTVASTSSTRYDGQIVRVGLNYHFNSFEDPGSLNSWLWGANAGAAVAAYAHEDAPRRWAGLYAGLNTGYDWDATRGVSTTAVPRTTTLDSTLHGDFSLASARSASGQSSAAANGFNGGAQIGYNYKADNFVLGAEGDIDGSGIWGRSLSQGSATAFVLGSPNPVSSSIETEKSVDWISTIRGRLGYLANPNLLAYGTGGLAIGGVSAQTATSQQFSGTIGNTLVSSGSTGHLSSTLVGWTLGGGLEWMFMPNMSIKAEYLYYDLGSERFAGSPLTTSFAGVSSTALPTSSVHFNGQIVRAGINYHFNLLDDQKPIRAAY